MVNGPSHANGGVKFILQDTGHHIEEEGGEVNIPGEISYSDQIYTFKGSNKEVLENILNIANLSLNDSVTTVKSGDIVICVRSVNDNTKRKFRGTIQQILHDINTSNGCKPILKSDKGGKLPRKTAKERFLEAQIQNPNSERWQKKKQRITELSNIVQKLRTNISRDIQSEDERLALTALVVGLMDRTAERIGNDDSAENGHFGVTGFQKKHISVVGNKVHLDYIGKSGKEHEKSFSDERIAKALKKAIKNAPGKFIFETSDGFRIKSDKVNRYLEPFNISAKDIRGYNANRWIIEQLHKAKKADTAKERKKIFNKAVKETALRVGHGSGTLKKHYMIPELPTEYINHGRIIEIKTLGYYKDGSIINKAKLPMKKYTVIYEFNHPKMGFQNSITLDANSPNEAIEKAKEEVSTTYGPKMLKRFSFKSNANFKDGGNTYVCFADYIKEKNPELVQQLSEVNISDNDELEQELDAEYKMWYGGRVKK